MKATVTYASGLMLKISKDYNQPALFMEWVSNFGAGKMPIHKIINDEDCKENDIFKIRMNLLREEMQNCADYINSNCLVL